MSKIEELARFCYIYCPDSKNEKNPYGLKSNRFPDKIDCVPLKMFEKELWELIKNVKSMLKCWMLIYPGPRCVMMPLKFF